MKSSEISDAMVIGAGFAGLYALHKLRSMGLSVVVLEAAQDVGGVWWWNRYPGARCDVESLQYSYSFDAQLEQDWKWSERYASQPEILRYIQHVASRFDLKRDIHFGTRVKSLVFDEAQCTWMAQTADASVYRSRHVIMATGALSVPRLPDIEGIGDFSGPILHTGAWPHEPVDFTGQQVAVIGTGSSGIQTIPQIAKQAAKLWVLQRTANFSIPAWNGPLSEAEQQAFKSQYRLHRERAREVGTLYEFNSKAASEVSESEREQEYERRWRKGGVNFVHAFNDLMVNKSSNDTISEYVRKQIRATVLDPEVAQSLCPNDHPLGTKRICVDTGYFETFNQAHVRLVDMKKTPIQRFTAHGMVIHSLGEVSLDALVCATGYDALSGALLAIDIRGRSGLSLANHWRDGPQTFLGLMTSGFPNLFIITGPGSPSVLANMIVGIEHHVDWIADCLAHLKNHQLTTIEAQRQAEQRWSEHVKQAAEKTLLPMAKSWFLGQNIPGKPKVFMPYVAKIGVYRRECQEVVQNGYQGFLLN